MNDNDFVLGIDIGTSTSAISYYEHRKKMASVLDISGGYGKVTIPTRLKYIEDTQEWVFGEYALEESGDNHLDPKNADQLKIFIEHLLENMQSINPSGVIKKIVLATPDNYTGDYYFKAMRHYGDETITFVPHSECVLNYHYADKKPMKEKILLLDYGQEALRAIIFESVGKDKIKQIGSFEDQNSSVKNIDAKLEEKFLEIYLQEQGETDEENLSIAQREGIKNFVHSAKDQLFIRQNRDIKLYMNFAYPPVKVDMTKEKQKEFISPLEVYFKKAISQKTKKLGFELSDIDTVICVGGGFEMTFAKNVISELFPDANITKYKNTKAIASMGAAIIAASYCGEGTRIEVEENNRLPFDIGTYIGVNSNTEAFKVLIDGENYYINKTYEFIFNVTQPTNKGFSLDLLKKDKQSEELSIFTALEMEPIDRPTYATRLKLSIKIEKDKIEIGLIDLGFGELFEPSAQKIEKVFTIKERQEEDEME